MAIPLPGFERRHGDRPLHHGLGRGEVPLEEQRGQRQRVADGVEAVGDLVARKILGRVEVDAEQVADGVEILLTIETPHRNPAGIGGRPPVGVREPSAHLRHEGIDLLRRGPRMIGRRHFPGDRAANGRLPDPAIATDRRIVLGKEQRDIPFRRFGSVACPAVAADEGRSDAAAGIQLAGDASAKNRRFGGQAGPATGRAPDAYDRRGPDQGGFDDGEELPRKHAHAKNLPRERHGGGTAGGRRGGVHAAT